MQLFHGSYRVILGAALCTLLAQSPSQTTFQVVAEVVEGCSVDGAPAQYGIDFGVLDFGSHPSTASGPISAMVSHGLGTFVLTCAPGTELSISVDAGQHAESLTRNLKHGAGSTRIPYSLYFDSNHGTPLDPDISVSATVPESGQLQLPIYGNVVLDGTALPSGSYSDDLSVSIVW